MKKLFFPFVCMLIFNLATISAQICGTTINNGQFNEDYGEEQEIGYKHRALKEPKKSSLENFIVFNVQFWIMLPEQGRNLSKKNLKTLLEKVNFLFKGANIQFKQHRNPKYLKKSKFSNFHRKQEKELYDKYSKKGVINIYIFENIQSLGKDKNVKYTGYTYHPLDKKRTYYQKEVIYLAYESIREQSTPAHEFGHFFGLFHTHENHKNQKPERVSRIGCRRTGDFICDTAADNDLRHSVDAVSEDVCIYTGKQKDQYGEFYQPLISNIMSYAPPSCRTEFTLGQSRVIWNTALIERVNLKHSVRTEKGINISKNFCRDLGCAERLMVKKGGPQKAIIFIYKKDVKWCQRMLRELFYSPKYSEVKQDYSLVVFEAEQNRAEILDFLDQAVFAPPHIYSNSFKYLHTQLEENVVRYPAVIVLELWNHLGDNEILENKLKKGGRQITFFNIGYLKPREFAPFLKENELIVLKD